MISICRKLGFILIKNWFFCDLGSTYHNTNPGHISEENEVPPINDSVTETVSGKLIAYISAFKDLRIISFSVVNMTEIFWCYLAWLERTDYKTKLGNDLF